MAVMYQCYHWPLTIDPNFGLKNCHLLLKKFPVSIPKYFLFPRDPITLSEDDWGVQSPPQESI